MSHVDRETLERLAALRDGGPSTEAELRAEAARDPDLAEAEARLAAIDRLAAALPAGLSRSAEDALIRAVLPDRSGPRFRVPIAAAAVAGLALGIAGTLAIAGPPAAAPVLAWAEGPVEVDGAAAGVGALRPGARVVTGDAGSALAVLDGGAVVLGGNSSARLADAAVLEDGTLLALGPEVSLRGPGAVVSLSGAALLSREPPVALARVTGGRHGREVDVAGLWNRIGSAAAGAVAGSVVTLLVIEGTAEVRGDGGRAVQVRAGEVWTAGEGSPRPAPAPSPARDPVAVAALARPDPGTTPGAPAAAELATLGREALVAEVLRLGDEHEALLREKHSLARQLDAVTSGELRQGTYHRMSPEQLAADAGRGKLRLRLPHVFRGPEGEELFGPEARAEVGLTPEERQAIEAIYGASGERIHRGLGELYVEIGGDPARVPELGADGLLRELQAKSHGDDFKAAIRLAANERAGLVPVGTGGPPVTRALRLLWQEDERVIAELDRLLGPERAQRFLDHGDASHSDATFQVGPAEK